VLLAVAAITGFVVLQISKTDPDYRVVFPGTEDMELSEGEYTLSYEHTSILNGPSGSSSGTPNLAWNFGR